MPAVSKPTEMLSKEGNAGRLLTEKVIRRVIIAILAVLALMQFGELERRIRFWCTDAVRVDGLTFYLNPDDECLTQYMLEQGSWEPEETRLLLERLEPGDTVIDVGANFGWYTVLASRAVGDDGMVIAFEPEPTNFALLKRNVEANGCGNVRLEQKALSSEPGFITLFIHEHNKGMHSTLQFNGSEGSIDVEAIRLDDYLTDCDRSIDLIKIDVEGAEGMVLEGMSKTLTSNPHMSLLLEFAPNRLALNGYDPERMLKDFVSYGFEIHEFKNSHTQPQVAGVSDILGRLHREHEAHANLLICGSSRLEEKP